MIDSALYLASLGFHVFPLRPGTKLPMWRGWTENATCDLSRVEAIWKARPDANIGILTTYYTNGKVWYGCGVDVDNKNGGRGSDSAVALGALLPETFVQRTPTGGFHYLYKSNGPVANSVGSLGPGLDTRGWRGYVVGAGSVVAAGQYTIALSSPVAEAPQGLVDLIGEVHPTPAEPRKGQLTPVDGIDTETATAWAVGYLKSLPEAPNGTIDNSAYAAAAMLKDRGLSPANIYSCLVDHFKSELPLDPDEAWAIANNAYKYGKNPAGSIAPEVVFKAALRPPQNTAGGVQPTPPPGPGENQVEWLNKDHAFVLGGAGGNILMEDLDSHSKPMLRVMGVEAFHNLNAGLTFTDAEGKPKQMSRVWMNSKNRRTYRGLEFAPGRELPAAYYNLWRGFAIDPQPIDIEPTQRAKDALRNYLYLVHHHISNGDTVVNEYLITWAAQMIQDPQNRPFVCPVIRGGKGTGKDTFLDVLGGLLGPHYWLTSEKEDLVGRFNEQLGKILLFGLNEAFWHGDHKVESTLKHLITGDRLRIEQKFCTPYMVDNLMRICIMGNADILVPATDDERRWLATDTRTIEPHEATAFYAFCGEIRAGMKAGGYALLLRYLMDYDITKVNLGFAPNTQALVDQKEAGLTPVQQYIRECLGAGRIVSASTPTSWGGRVDKELFRDGFRRWAREHGISGREPSEQMIGRQINRMKLGIDGSQKRVEGTRQINQYSLPGLEDCRKSWDVFIKAVKETKW